MLAIAFSAKIRSRLWKNQYAIDMLPICCRYAFDMLSVCCWKIVIQRHGRSRANVTCLHRRFVMHEASSKKLSESVGGHNPAPPAWASVLSKFINKPIVKGTWVWHLVCRRALRCSFLGGPLPFRVDAPKGSLP